MTAADLTLVQSGKSDYRIVVPSSPPANVQLAATELQDYLRQVSGAELPIITDDQPPAPNEILLGDNRRLQQLNLPVEFSKLGGDGYVLRTAGDRLVIAGGPKHGTLYGVYGFLEDNLNCRWYSSKVRRVPRQSTIVLAPLNVTQVPAFKYREVFYRDTMNPAFARCLKLNGSSNVNPGENEWGSWCHSFYSFVPPEKFFATHPEYYSLVNGKRTHTFMYAPAGPVEYTAQLCLSNPDVLKVIIDELKRRMQASPQAHYWSISQMDGHLAACQCAGCRGWDEREESPMGSILHFVNQVAAEFPDQTITTLAYTYTRHPPKTLRPAPNVGIQLCDIECPRTQAARPIATDPSHQSFRDDLEGWTKICDKVLIWDYVIQFGSLVSPYPNLRVLQPNLRYYAGHHVLGVFAQGNREIGGEFCELRAYLLAKLLWNPDCDVNAVIDDFLSGYYGPAAGPIRRYID
ncbi:MAG: DUF4838 domain-containing protein, partial [Candidatus Omnitrophica bacterium]|nr:DUF4838 domain-containing protein [Candidatus Omnitrophota bacterium]